VVVAARSEPGLSVVGQTRFSAMVVRQHIIAEVSDFEQVKAIADRGGVWAIRSRGCMHLQQRLCHVRRHKTRRVSARQCQPVGRVCRCHGGALPHLKREGGGADRLVALDRALTPTPKGAYCAAEAQYRRLPQSAGAAAKIPISVTGVMRRSTPSTTML